MSKGKEGGFLLRLRILTMGGVFRWNLNNKRIMKEKAYKLKSRRRKGKSEVLKLK